MMATEAKWETRVREAEAAEKAARRELDAVRFGARDAGDSAKRVAEEAYLSAHDYEGAKARLTEAVRALVAAQDAIPAHEWEGRRVLRIEQTDSTWRRIEKRIEGIVETVRSTTSFAENLGAWRRPENGTSIVRLLKKDGSPGLKFEALARPWEKPWVLADEGEPK